MPLPQALDVSLNKMSFTGKLTCGISNKPDDTQDDLVSENYLALNEGNLLYVAKLETFYFVIWLK